MNNILVFRTVGGFMVRDGNGGTGSGQTWMEALGALVAAHPERYNIQGIRYNNDLSTRNYVIERDVPTVIVKPA